MKTEDLFKYGVTPKSGENAGKRFRVLFIAEDDISVAEWGEGKFHTKFKHGEYEVWREPKTLFQDSSVKFTWGNLKKAMWQAGLPDDTEFYVGGLLGFAAEPAHACKIFPKNKDFAASILIY